MFATCESGYVVHMLDEDEETLDMPEPSSTLIMLFNFLHYPPEPYLEHRKTKELLGSDYDYTKIQPLSAPSEIIIPFPILPLLLRLSDKYRFTQENTTCLYSHLTAYASTYPLRVYGYAIELGLESVAAKTSIYLLHPPLSSYSPEDMKVIPTAEALQKLVRLHDYRIKKLGQVLDEEVVFPYGYGLCMKHGQKTKSLWNQRKHHLNPLIQAGAVPSPPFFFFFFGTLITISRWRNRGILFYLLRES